MKPKSSHLVRAAVKALGTFLLVFSASLASAQIIVDPHTVEFDPSPDHNATTSTGLPLVSRYELEFFYAGATQAFQVLDLGKPIPQADGKIRVSFLPSWPTSGFTFEARVAAIGPTGIGVSTPSNTFGYTGACSYALSPTSLTIGAAGGPVSVNVLAGSTCAWSGTSPVSWITVLNSAHTGSGTLSVSVTANTGTTARTTTLTIAGQPVTATQSAASTTCTFSISTTTLALPSSGGSGSIAVTAPAGCSWTSVGLEWARFSTGSGTGSGSVTYVVDPSLLTTVRTATLKVAGQTVAVTQAAAGGCSASVSTTNVSDPATGGSGSIGVTTASGCGWTASSPVAWVTISPASASGPGSAAYTVAANTTSTPRSATLMVAGKPVTVSESGVCAFTVSPTSMSAPVTGGSGTIAVTTTAGCGWTATSPVSWVTFGAPTTTGETYTVAANTTTTPRSATLTVAGKPVAISQAGGACAYTLSTAAVSTSAGGGSGTIGITTTSGCEWMASSPVSWVTVGAASGSGSASEAYTVAANPTSTPRSATLTVAWKSVTVSQAGGACAFTVSPTSVTAPAAGGSSTLAVTTTSGCGWTASSPVSWVTFVTTAGSASASATYTVAANTTSIARSATLLVAGKSVVLSQPAASLACAMSISTSVISMPSAGGTGNIAVAAPAGCGWTATGGEWAWFSAPSAGTGDGSVTYHIDPNPWTTVRSSTVKVAGQTVTVTQAAGGNCTFSASPSNVTVPAGGTIASITLWATTGCGWTASSPVSWITVSPASGSSSAQITYTVAANTTSTSRSAALSFAGQSVTVVQSGSTPGKGKGKGTK